jgi:hypothetical protein
LTRDQQCYVIEVALPEGGEMRRLLPESLVRGALAPAENGAGLARRVGFRGELVSGEWIEVDHHIVRIGTMEPGPIQPILDAMRQRGAVIKAVKPARPTLEDLFMQAVTDPHTGETLAPGAARNGGRR